MQLIIERNTLLRALSHVTGLVERRNTIPILSNVLVVAMNEGEFVVKATDLDMEAVETVAARISQPGSVTISAHTLHDIAKKLPEGSEVRLERQGSDGRIKVVAGRSTFELSILPADEFPDMGSVDLPYSFEISGADLKRLFEKARFAISTEETRYYLNGIFLHSVEAADGPKLRAVATDGHRLAQIEMVRPSGAEGMPGVIVPRKAVQEILKLVEPQTVVRVALSAAKIRFAAGDLVLTSKLIDGSFPDYARVIPTSNKRLLRVENADLVKAVDRVSTLSSEKGRAIKLEIGHDRVVVSASSPDAGFAMEEIPAEYDNEPFEIGFNARYLLDIAGQIGGGKASFRLGDPSSPTLVSDDNDDASLYVLMPMRV